MYDGQTFTFEGRTYSFRTEVDSDSGEPWAREDGHGVVSEWTNRPKGPGERVLCEDRGSRRLYDFAATVRMARKEWTCPSKGRRARAAKMADEDFERLRGWCLDRWCYVGVIVTLLDNGKPTERTASVWGVESDAGEYFRGLALELAADIGAELLTVDTLGEPVV